jgi:multimeric flavodoxin WrbA
MKILILNGSPTGASGNCGAMVRHLERSLEMRVQKSVKDALSDFTGKLQWKSVHLATAEFNGDLKNLLFSADAVIFVTGTYWDSWGSPLQKFLEQATELELHPKLLGKPAGVVVLMHSVGGKAVLSRLQGVLSTFGFMIPPLTGLVHSLAGQLASENSTTVSESHADDFWCLEDLEVILQNLLRASGLKATWETWPVDRENFRKTWVK